MRESLFTALENRWLLQLAVLRRAQLFRADPILHQERVLRRLLRRSKNTESGRTYGFSSMDSSRQFLSRVRPTSYGSLRPQIDRIAKGRGDVLFPGRPRCFGITTGSEDEPKLIPLNDSLLRSTRMAAIDAALLGSLRRGSLSWHRGKTLYIGPRRADSSDSWTVFCEGTAFVYLQAGWLTARFVPAYNELPDSQAGNDHVFLKTCIDRHPIRSLAGNPMEIVRFVTATPTVMPDVEMVMNCGYWAADHEHIYHEAFPNATVTDIYGTNEGTWGLPVSAGRFLLNYRRVFFSFLPLDGADAAVGLDHAEVERKYRLCVTTPGGLWNYVTGDVVCLQSIRPPIFLLCGRHRRAVPLEGGWLTEDEVVGAVRKSGWQGLDYYLAPRTDRFSLCFDGAEPNTETVDKHLCQMNAAYGRLRTSGRLAALIARRTQIVRHDRVKPARIKTEPESKENCHETSLPPDQDEYLP